MKTVRSLKYLSISNRVAGQLLFACALFLLGCGDSIERKDLELLNGYWEIDQVIFPDGNKKQYDVSTSVDFIYLEGLKGYRKKVRPKLNGTFETSNDAEAFEVSEAKGSYFLNYRTNLSQRQEKLIALDEDTFSVTNQDGLKYEYRKFVPFDLQTK